MVFANIFTFINKHSYFFITLFGIVDVVLIYLLMKPAKKSLNQTIITDEFKAAVKGIDLNLDQDEKEENSTEEISILDALEELYSKKYITKAQYDKKKKALLN
jgi:hypothetical protein